jgi:hypothetical protein
VIVEADVAKLMFAPPAKAPPFVVSRVVLPPSVTAVLLRVIDPAVVVIFPPSVVVGEVPTPV